MTDFSILLVMILVTIFFAVSMSIMRQVISMFLFQFFGFGIRMMLAFFHAGDISFSSKIQLKFPAVLCELWCQLFTSIHKLVLTGLQLCCLKFLTRLREIH